MILYSKQECQNPYCRSPLVIFRSAQGGFVKQACVNSNCERFGKDKGIGMEELPMLKCESCGVERTWSIEKRHGYNGYVGTCPKCGNEWRLGQLVPYWQELAK